MKNLIIGGSGFVGSFLIESLEKKETKNYDKNQSLYFKNLTTIGNILDINKLRKVMVGVESVVLLAAEHRDDVSPTKLYYDVNVTGTKNVLDLMDEIGIKKLIFTSTVAVYGLNKLNPNEKSLPDPFNHYGKSKIQAEKLIHSWYNNDPENKSVTIIRPTVIFGERNRGNMYNLMKKIHDNSFVMIGNGKNKKSVAYIRNVVAFIVNRLNNEEKGLNIYNYVDKPDMKMNELILILKKEIKSKNINIKIPYFLALFIGLVFDGFSFLLKKNFTVSYIRIKKFCASTQYDAKKANDIFKPPFSIQQGLVKTIDYEFSNCKK
tara:strand:- start:79 stop:1038 length:960 start_codon:yes stop_codon:yes gene_type:complete